MWYILSTMLTQAEYYSNYHIGYKRPGRRNFMKISFWIASLLALAIVTLSFLNMFLPIQNKSANIISPLAGNYKLEALSSIVEKSENASLSKIVENNLKDKKGTYAVGILSLTTGDEYFKNKHQEFDSASLYKLWVMGLTYEKIENGTLKKDTILSDSIENLNSKFNIASESAERTEGEIKMSVKNAVNLMISKSDNYSALLLSSYLGISKIQIYLNEHGFSDSKLGSTETLPTTSVYDMLQFFYKLYYGELADKEFSEEMVTILRQQVLNNKLPKHLPDNIEIAHKTGELGKYSHDAGIIYSPTGPYILVVLSETDNKKTADETIAQISKDVYDYLQ